jgi:hypothetical protein
MSVNISHFFLTSLQPPPVNSSTSESSRSSSIESSGTPTSPSRYQPLNLSPTQPPSIYLPEKRDIGSKKFKLFHELTDNLTLTDSKNNETLIKEYLSDEPRLFLKNLIAFLQKQIKKNIQNSRRKLITVLLFTKKNYPELLKKVKISRRLLFNSLKTKFQIKQKLNKGTFKTAYLAVDPNTHQDIVLLLQRLHSKDLPQILHELSVGDKPQTNMIPSFKNSSIIRLDDHPYLISQVTKANVFNVNEKLI